MQKIEVAKVLKPQGLKGEVKLKVYNIKDSVLKLGTQVFLKNNESLTINSIRERAGFFYVTFEGKTKIEEIEYLKNEVLFVMEDELPELEEDEYFVKDLIGATVKLNSGKELGVVTEIENYGAADIYTVVKNKTEILFSLVEGLFLSVDLKNKVIIVDESILEEVMV